MFGVLLRFTRVKLPRANLGVIRFCVPGPFLLVFWGSVFVVALGAAWVNRFVLSCSLRSGVVLDVSCLDGGWSFLRGSSMVNISFFCTFVGTVACSSGGITGLALWEVG